MLSLFQFRAFRQTNERNPFSVCVGCLDCSDNQLKNHLKGKGHPTVNPKRVEAWANGHHLAAGRGPLHLPSLLEMIKSSASYEDLEANVKWVLALMGVRWTNDKNQAVPIYDRAVFTTNEVSSSLFNSITLTQ